MFFFLRVLLLSALQVSGMIKSIFGLSSAVLSVLYAGLFGASGVGRFLLLLSVGVPLLGALSSIPMNVVPAKHLAYATERAQGVSHCLSKQRAVRTLVRASTVEQGTWLSWLVAPSAKHRS